MDTNDFTSLNQHTFNMLKKILFIIGAVLIFVSCSTNDKYDSSVCQDFINKYCYEIAFNGNSTEYDASLKNISQQEFSDIIGQLKGIITTAYTELTDISVLQSRTEMKERYEQFNDQVMIQQFKYLNGIVDDAKSLKLLDSQNKKAYDELQPIIEDVASTDIQIKYMIR